MPDQGTHDHRVAAPQSGFDIAARAKRHMPLFLCAAVSIAIIRLLRGNGTLGDITTSNISTGIWLTLYLVVLNEFRKVEFKSSYFRTIFVVFSIFFILQTVMGLPILREIMPAGWNQFREVANILIDSCWTVSCGLVLHGLLISMHSVERVSLAKDEALQLAMESEKELLLAQFSLDVAIDSVLWIQRNGAIVYANDAARRLTGSALNPAHIWDVDVRFDPESWRHFWGDANVSSGAAYETEFLRAEQAAIEMEVRAYRFSDEQHDLLCMVARDISERRRLQGEVQQRLSELSHLSRMQTASEMVAGMAHELNQPLAAVANYSHVMASALAGSDAAVWEDETQRTTIAEKAKIISEESLRAGEIIRRLRRLVNKREPRRKATDLNRLVLETLRIFDSQWLDAANPIVAELDEMPAEVEIDDIQIQQVLLNLLSNAKDAVQQENRKPRIVVSTSRAENGTIVVTVQDNGKGFDGFGEEKLFQPFVSTKTNGMGLGLSISRSIAKAHAGDLTATQNPSGGATFCLTLPSAPA